MTEEQKKLLEKQLWKVADSLRGKMNADEYKNYILGFIFYKYLSERLAFHVEEKLLNKDEINFADINEFSAEGKQYVQAVKAACLDDLGYFLNPHELFEYIVKKGKGEVADQDNFILEDLKKILNHIEQTSLGTESEEDFKGLFHDVDLSSTKLGSTEKEKNETIVEVLTHLAEIDFRLQDAKSDVLGDAYEYLIGEFAAGAGKKGGEFYTPAQVSRLLAMIVSNGKPQLKSVYDPTCGSGSLLLRVSEFSDVKYYYGQELNPTTFNLARMNMILHGVHFSHFRIFRGDTLTNDGFSDLQAEAIVANPPFSAVWKSNTDPVLEADERFAPYGRLAPKSAADYAFVTHMLHHLADNGTMAVVLPHGALFRSGAEGVIRRHIIEKLNYLDAVIGLPANLFYGTSIPATIMVFKKCRKEEDNILFIDASKGFTKNKNQNVLEAEHLNKIFEVYTERKAVEKYSHLATHVEIVENDFNLNIPRYVDTFEEEEPIDINAVASELRKLQAEEIEIQKKLAGFCEELGIEKPF